MRVKLCVCSFKEWEREREEATKMLRKERERTYDRISV